MKKFLNIMFLTLLFVSCGHNLLCAEQKNNQGNQTENVIDTYGYFRINPVDQVDNSDFVRSATFTDEDENSDIAVDIETLALVDEIERIEQAAQTLSAVEDNQLIEKKLQEFKPFFENLIEKSSNTLNQLIQGAEGQTDGDDLITHCYEQTFALALQGWFYTKIALAAEDQADKEQVFKKVVSIVEAISLQTRECIITGLAHD